MIMITLLILLILFVGLYSGYKNGVILQLVKAIGYVVAFTFAFDYYEWVSEYLYLLIPYPTPFAPESNPYYFYDENLMFSLDTSYYHLISFLLIFVVGWVIVRVLAQLLSYTIEKIRVPEPFNGMGGAVIGVIINYIVIFYFLFLASLVPLDLIQDRLTDSSLAKTMLTSTPNLSESTYQRFVVDAHEEYEHNRPIMDINQPTEENNEEETTEENEE